MAEAEGQSICVGVIAGAHGVRGQVRIKSFTDDPGDLTGYGPVADARGRSLEVTVTGRSKGQLLARIAGITDRDAAQALKGTRLYVPRAALPELEDDEEYYRGDLIGLSAEDRAGRALGTVVAVENFGAGDVVEIERPDKATFMVPFTKAAVPEIDLAGGRLVIDPPEEIEAGPE